MADLKQEKRVLIRLPTLPIWLVGCFFSFLSFLFLLMVFRKKVFRADEVVLLLTIIYRGKILGNEKC